VPVKRTTPYTKYQIGEEGKRLFSIAPSFYIFYSQPADNHKRMRTWGESTIEKGRSALALSSLYFLLTNFHKMCILQSVTGGVRRGIVLKIITEVIIRLPAESEVRYQDRVRSSGA